MTDDRDIPDADPTLPESGGVDGASIDVSAAKTQSTDASSVSAPNADTPIERAPSTTVASAWIAASDDASGLGRVMLTRDTRVSGSEGGTADHGSSSAVPAWATYLQKFMAMVAPNALVLADSVSLLSHIAANDNSVWVGAENDDDGNGHFGFDASAATLPGGHTVVAWIGEDRIIHAKSYPEDPAIGAPLDLDRNTQALNDVLANLGTASQAHAASNGRVKVVPYGQDSFAALWIADFGFTAALMGKTFMLTTALDGAAEHDNGARVWSSAMLPPLSLPTNAVSITALRNGDGGLKVQLVPDVSATSNMVADVQEVVDGVVTLVLDINENGGLSLDMPWAELSTTLQALGSSQLPELLQSVAAETDTAEVTPATPAEADGAGATADAADGTDASDGMTDAAATDGISIEDLAASIDVLAGGDGGNGGSSGGAPASDGKAGYKPAAKTVAVAGGDDDTVVQRAPSVVVTESNTIAVLYQSAGSAPGTAELTVSMMTAEGQPVRGDDGAPVAITVTSHALVDDGSGRDYAPALSAAGSGIAVAWVDSHTGSSDGGSDGQTLNLSFYSGHGRALQSEPITIALTTSPGSTLSDLDLESYGAADGCGGGDVDVAIVWVSDADNDGYGTVNGQRFGLKDIDGKKDKSDTDANAADASDETSSDGSGSGDEEHGSGEGTTYRTTLDVGPVYGRAPDLAALGAHAMAIGWLEHVARPASVEASGGSDATTTDVAATGVDTSLEVVRAIVMRDGTPGGLALDLSAFMPDGVAKGTEPELLGTADGDLVIGWISGEKDSYSASMAVFRATGDGGWVTPESAVVLRHFDDKPDDINFALTSEDGQPALLLTWRDSGDLSAQTFDLDGAAHAAAFDIDTDGDSGSSGDGAGTTEDFAAAVTDAGHIIVVYTERDGDDTDITALIIDPTRSSSGSSDSDEESGNSGPGNGGGSGGAVVADAISVDFDGDAIMFAADADQPTSDADIAALSLSTATFTVADVTETIETFNAPPANPAIVTSSEASYYDDDQTIDDTINMLDDQIAFVGAFGGDLDAVLDSASFANDNAADEPNSIDSVFQSLQFANALSADVNEHIITFDAANVATIRDLDPI